MERGFPALGNRTKSEENGVAEEGGNEFLTNFFTRAAERGRNGGKRRRDRKKPGRRKEAGAARLPGRPDRNDRERPERRQGEAE